MGVRYDPVGRCIYCGSIEEPIDREHIIPFGLNGDLILPKASCRPCAQITSKIEGYCLQTMFGNMRYAMGMKSRGKTSKPETLTARFREADDSIEEVEVPLSQYPPAIMLFELPPARILMGLPDDGAPTQMHGLWCWTNAKPLGEVGTSRKDKGLVIEEKINPTKFSQMLAKIGHSYAVAALGLDAFKPMAVDLALGRSESMNYLVGSGVNFDIGPIEGDGLHQMAIYTHDSGTILALIKLFARINAPLFHVVIGLKENGHIVPFIKSVPHS